MTIASARPPACPTCTGPMDRKRARTGPRAGLEFWGCRRFPACDGLINIEPSSAAAKADPAVTERESRNYAQTMFERARARDRLKRRALLPLAVAFGLMLVALGFVVAVPLGRPWIWLVPALVMVVWILGLVRLPFEAIVWAKGIEGERAVAAALEPLKAEGFVLLANRPVPLARGDIDCIAIGPTGIFTIEIKNWGGRATVRNNALWVGTADRSWVVDQVYKEALAVQLALALELNVRRLTVMPVICVVGGLSGAEHSIRGVHLLDVRDIASSLRELPKLLDDDGVVKVATLADKAFPEPLPWDESSMN